MMVVVVVRRVEGDGEFYKRWWRLMRMMVGIWVMEEFNGGRSRMGDAGVKGHHGMTNGGEEKRVRVREIRERLRARKKD